MSLGYVISKFQDNEDIVEFSLGEIMEDGSCDLDDNPSQADYDATNAAFKNAGHELQREAENLYSIEVATSREATINSVHTICQGLGATRQSGWE